MLIFPSTSIIFLWRHNSELPWSLLLESGSNWCPWQALVLSRLPLYHISLSFVVWVKFKETQIQFYLLNNILASIKCNIAIAIHLLSELLYLYTLGIWVEQQFDSSSMHVFDRPSMSSCGLPLKVAEATGRILELRDMPACVNSTIPTFSWHMLAWKIPYIKSDYMLLCATKTYVWLLFFSSEKQYFAAFGSSLFLFILTISEMMISLIRPGPKISNVRQSTLKVSCLQILAS